MIEGHIGVIIMGIWYGSRSGGDDWWYVWREQTDTLSGEVGASTLDWRYKEVPGAV